MYRDNRRDLIEPFANDNLSVIRIVMHDNDPKLVSKIGQISD